MSDGWALLRETIVANYEEIKRKLARSLGSRDLASEVIQETYLRFHRADGFSAIEKPEAFIYRTALNIATDKRREEKRHASQAQVLAAIQVEGDVRDFSTEMEARLQIQTLKRALAELPPRRRAIFIAARVDGMSHEDIARCVGLSRTMVQKELRRALAHCLSRLENETGS
jgi:RNA polymerase sigma-70 factor (ECF subfamily)